ncbi:UDP-N-acetylmuramoyl-L-alanine--D-glutamate ligase [Candidatus Liberibacter asiaticus]|uniref:UDP-N-acetylmuramoyl-L-alanine--D-glutamate ligase n=1 Tax=Liberibacter asiaticus TaxID=34021 RepID=UPI0004E092F5|nr:UDP-N-acetylmuramoyl-L-alanine--D-glutamate ligase [Candidatus Liberibacter asiaticus]BAP26868.1 UDP-N-acetylmuramoyl-L-alanyl-D-glutamate synthetase [Candidatus Liberibacter asiaticus str. Ishi-1]
MKLSSFRNHSIAVFGLGRSGLSAACALKDSGVHVIAWDDHPCAVKQAKDMGIEVIDFREIPWSIISFLVLSPGIALTGENAHWCVKLANQFNVEIIGDIELFVRERRFSSLQSPFIAVTGTNGKSSTVALISHVLRKNGYDVQLGGNIGLPILNLEYFSPNRFYVIECSSYQIELTPTIDPSIGVLLNISPDHLDRHHTLENYVNIKKKIVTMSKHAIICINDHQCEKIAYDMNFIGHSISRISSQSLQSDSDLYIDESFLKCSATSEVIFDFSQETKKHNIQNLVTSAVVCMQLGLKVEEIKRALLSCGGLTHRLQTIARLGHVIFINDSKATNLHSVIHAFLNEKRRIYWIAGGLSKSDDFSTLFPFISKIAKAYFIGNSGMLFFHHFGGKINSTLSKTLDQALKSVVRDVENVQLPSIVLFSPGCASFDQYNNFRERGFSFMSQVSEIPGIEMLVDIEEERKSLW